MWGWPCAAAIYGVVLLVIRAVIGPVEGQLPVGVMAGLPAVVLLLALATKITLSSGCR